MKLNFGPGVLVAAAFIGPGTVTACTLAGANFGFVLIWALIFATLATVILQDMSARLGAGAKLGLGEALMQATPWRPVRVLVAGLVFAALVIGNCAYEGGNLAGGALGLDAIFNAAGLSQSVWVSVIALGAGLAVFFGRYAFLERFLITLVLLMSAAFIVSAVLVRPDFGAILDGLVPRIPTGGTLTAIALIGTTVVPYNLFLHAAAAREKYTQSGAERAARQESALSIGLGGLVSILILSTAAASLFQTQIEVRNAGEMALAIEPAFGSSARYFVGVGLFAAGLTSAITAPMATAYALSELLGDRIEDKRRLFQSVALSVVAIGATINLAGLKPVSLILIAQYANGLLLPIIAGFLLYVMNQRDLLGSHVNNWAANVAGLAVVLTTLGLGLRSILRAAGFGL